MKATVFHAGRHLTEAELLSPGDCCPICRRADGRRAVHRIQENPRVDLVECGVCRGASASRMPRPEVLDAYYRDYYAGKEAHVTCPDSTGFAAGIARDLTVPRGLACLRILDFGGGDGSLGVAIASRLMATAGAARSEVTLVDYEAPLETVPPGVAIRGHREVHEVEGPFDVVVASAVLEHIPDVHEAARRLFERVAPGGFFYARTPYLAPFARLPLQHLDLTYPAHVHDLGGSFWNRVCETFSLDADVVRSGPSPVEADVRTHPLRAIGAYVLKLPARLESRCFAGRRDPWWKWVGGWEVVLRFRDAAHPGR